jgi:aspartate/methionine/tyrosine aminotransferase
MPRKLFLTQAERMEKIPPYLLGQQFSKKTRFKPEEIIDLGRAIPDLDPPQAVRDEIAAWVSSRTDFYQSSLQIKAELKQEFTGWFAKRYRIVLSPEKEVLLLPGQREAINLVALGLVNSRFWREMTFCPISLYPSRP